MRAKEGVHFGFGFNVPGGVVRMDVPWGVVRPELDQIPGACKNWFTVQRWVDISNEDFGVTWLTPDAPLVEVGGITANLIGSLAGSAGLDGARSSRPRHIYSWVMNNHWHTNYRAEQEGPTVFRYLLWPHSSPSDLNQPARVALECSQPLLVLAARGDEPKLFSPLASVSGAQVTAFKPSEDGKARIVRLYNPTGKAEKARLTWSDPQPGAIWLSDTSERPLRLVTGPVELLPYGVVTLRTELP